ncbi:MAG: LamG domain-containing protein [Planctomycetota bacterium]|jgi:hypothetical protein
MAREVNFKKLFLSAVVLLLLCSDVMADGLVGWWKFDERSGDKVADFSGHGHDGKVFGVTSWEEGYIGEGALQITGGGVKIADSPLLRPARFTVVIWVKFADSQGELARLFQKGNDNWETINITGGGPAQDGRPCFNKVGFSVFIGPNTISPSISVAERFKGGKWLHIAAVYDGSDMLLYVDGKVASSKTVGEIKPYAVEGEPLVIGNRPPDMDRGINGAVDDIRMYNRPLSAEEVWELYVWKGKDQRMAALPEPADRVSDLMPSQVLGWKSGKNAAKHNVYFGADYESVANAKSSSREFKGSQAKGANTFDPGKLEFGQTYYWRIDEVSGGKAFEGDVWRFKIIDGKAGKPSPGVLLKTAATDTKLNWTRGGLAVSHDLYFGSDADEVRSATTSSRLYKGTSPIGWETYDPGPLKEGTYYYWRVDENCKEGTARGDLWKFRTKGGNLVLQVDLAVPTCDLQDIWEGTAKPGWTILASGRWADMYMHDGVWFPEGGAGAFEAGINGTGIKAYLSTGSEGQLGIAVKGVCRNNLGGGGCPSGEAQGDAIANSWAYAVDWAGPYAGDIILLLKDLPPGVYELLSYHNHWEPCTQGTRNCLDCVCGMPPMPSVTANALPARTDESSQDRSDNILSNYRWNLPPGTGKGVRAIRNAYNVAPQHVYSDDELAPSLIEFETDGSEVLIIYQADRSEPLYPDCARPGREGARGILNAFELINIGPPTGQIARETN